MGRMKDIFLLHQQEIEERERIEHLDRWAAYLAETREARTKTGESHNPKEHANDHREQKKGVHPAP